MVFGACSDESIPDVNWLYQGHGERHGARHYSDDCKALNTPLKALNITRPMVGVALERKLVGEESQREIEEQRTL